MAMYSCGVARMQYHRLLQHNNQVIIKEFQKEKVINYTMFKNNCVICV